MKVQGVNADYARRMQAAGLHPDADELIAMKLQGVSPEYVRGLKEQGHGDERKTNYRHARAGSDS